MVAQEFSEKSLAVAVTIDPGGIEEIAAKIHGALERVEGFGVVGTGPSGHSPHSVANLADVPSGAAEAAIAHEKVLLLNWESIIGAKRSAVRWGRWGGKEIRERSLAGRKVEERPRQRGPCGSRRVAGNGRCRKS